MTDNPPLDSNDKEQDEMLFNEAPEVVLRLMVNELRRPFSGILGVAIVLQEGKPLSEDGIKHMADILLTWVKATDSIIQRADRYLENLNSDSNGHS